MIRTPDRQGFRVAVGKIIADEESAEALAAQASGDPDCLPEVDVFIAVPAIPLKINRHNRGGAYSMTQRRKWKQEHPAGETS